MAVMHPSHPPAQLAHAADIDLIRVGAPVTSASGHQLLPFDPGLSSDLLRIRLEAHSVASPKLVRQRPARADKRQVVQPLRQVEGRLYTDLVKVHEAQRAG